MNRIKANLLYVLCAIYSLIAGLYPFEFSSRTLHLNRNLPWELLSFLMVRLRDVGLDDFLTNIFYFLPWGALVYVCGSPRSRTLSSILRAALVGGIVSFSIEVSQIFFMKEPSIFDVLANTFGALLGALLCAFSPLDVRRLVARCFARVERSRLMLPAAIFLGLVPLLISVSRFSGSGLKLSKRHYTSQLGKERSRETPWRGMLNGAAVYDRALAPEEIAQNYRLSASSDALEHREYRGLVVLCTFAKSHRDGPSGISDCGLAPNLALLPSSHFRWLQGLNGVDVLKPVVLKGERSAKKLFDAIRGRDELTVETWMTATKIDENRAAGIVSLSRDSVGHKLVVGQKDVDIGFHARGRISNASAAEITTGNGFLTAELFQLVVTYKDGVHHLFVNGRKYPNNNFDLRLANFIVSFGNNRAAQFAYSFVYFFPVSFLLSHWLSKRSFAYPVTLLVAASIAVALLGTTEAFQAWLFARSVDLAFVGHGVVVVLAGALCGMFFAQETTGADTTFSFV